jgi:hypothetical protein
MAYLSEDIQDILDIHPLYHRASRQAIARTPPWQSRISNAAPLEWDALHNRSRMPQGASRTRPGAPRRQRHKKNISFLLCLFAFKGFPEANPQAQNPILVYRRL